MVVLFFVNINLGFDSFVCELKILCSQLSEEIKIKLTGRSDDIVSMIEAYLRANKMFVDYNERPWCTLPLNRAMMPISHFLLVLISWSIQSLFDAVPILKIFWRRYLACLRLLYSLPAKAFMLNNY